MYSNKELQKPKKTKNVSQKQLASRPKHLARDTSQAAVIQGAIADPKYLTQTDVLQLQRTIGNRAVGQLMSEIRLVPSYSAQQEPVQRQVPVDEEELLQGKMMDTVQRQVPEEEELLQGNMMDTIQRQGPEEEEELLQGKMMDTVQRQVPEEEELLQGKMMHTIRQVPEEEELLQGKMMDTVQRKVPEEEELMQGKFASGLTGTLQAKEEAPPNKTGMPDHLKAGIENLSGTAMDDVKVHYNSDKPAHVQALAYTQGTDIHVGPGQDKHLPHEAWHVVQQMQGRVRPTMQAKGVAINDDAGLEREADVMGAKAHEMETRGMVSSNVPIQGRGTVQIIEDNVTRQEVESTIQRYSKIKYRPEGEKKVKTVYVGKGSMSYGEAIYIRRIITLHQKGSPDQKKQLEGADKISYDDKAVQALDSLIALYEGKEPTPLGRTTKCDEGQDKKAIPSISEQYVHMR